MYAFDCRNPASPASSGSTTRRATRRCAPARPMACCRTGTGLAFSGLDTTFTCSTPAPARRSGPKVWDLLLLDDHRHAAGADRPDHRAGVAVRDRGRRAQRSGALLQPRLRLSLAPDDRPASNGATTPWKTPSRSATAATARCCYGPSGAPIWNSPVVDEKRGLIYFGTGESNSPPAHKNTDALIAIRLADGKQALEPSGDRAGHLPRRLRTEAEADAAQLRVTTRSIATWTSAPR